MILLCAAGSSKRMAPLDKLLLPLGDATLLERSIQAALHPGHPVCVALPEKPNPRWDIVEPYPVVPMHCAGSSEGLSGTLRDAVAQIPSHVTHLCVVLADLPAVQAHHFTDLFDHVRANPDAKIWRYVTSAGRPGHPIVFHRDTFEAFIHLTGDDGAKSILATYTDQTSKLILNDDAIRADIDTPQDWEDYLSKTK